MLPCKCKNTVLLHCCTTYWLEQCFCGDFMSPGTTKCTWVFIYIAQYFCSIITKLWFSQQIFTEVSNIKFQKNPSSGGWTDTCRQMDTHVKASRHFSCIRESALKQLEMRIQTAPTNSPQNICTKSSGYGAH